MQNYRKLFFLIKKLFGPFMTFNTHTHFKGDMIHLCSEIKTGHLLRKYELHLTKFYAVTWGYDGFVIARDKHFEDGVGMALPHHRYLGGTKKAYIHPLGAYILSLGRDNVVACTKVVKNVLDLNRKLLIEEMMGSTKLALMFKRPTIGYKPKRKCNTFIKSLM